MSHLPDADGAVAVAFMTDSGAPCPPQRVAIRAASPRRRHRVRARVVFAQALMVGPEQERWLSRCEALHARATAKAVAHVLILTGGSLGAAAAHFRVRPAFLEALARRPAAREVLARAGVGLHHAWVDAPLLRRADPDVTLRRVEAMRGEPDAARWLGILMRSPETAAAAREAVVRTVTRARSAAEVAQLLGVSRPTLLKWRTEFQELDAQVRGCLRRRRSAHG
jgi:hypothetical protein